MLSSSGLKRNYVWNDSKASNVALGDNYYAHHNKFCHLLWPAVEVELLQGRGRSRQLWLDQRRADYTRGIQRHRARGISAVFLYERHIPKRGVKEFRFRSDARDVLPAAADS